VAVLRKELVDRAVAQPVPENGDRIVKAALLV
jgi:hypothetical protein